MLFRKKRNESKKIKENKKQRVVVGISGGVDSAYSAYLLKQQGYDVVGFFMNNWDKLKNKELNNIMLDEEICQQEQDYQDAKLVANFLGIELHKIDLVDEYWEFVFKKFLNDLENGITPNPDILCNRYIKFDKFITKIEEKIGSFDYIATGHYANIESINDKYFLTRAKDKSKDQTYFLSEINPSILNRIIFPLGNINKKDLREEAKKINLPVALKKDSTGICFIGKRNFPDFISNWFEKNPGQIIDIDTNKVVGEHNGIIFYTIGQRKGLNLSGFENSYYVVKKDIKNNILYVGQKDNELLLSKKITAINFNLLVDKQTFEWKNLPIEIKIRHSVETHLAKIIDYQIDEEGKIKIEVETDQKIKAVTPGQELVIYKGKIVLGGGQIIDNV